MRRRVATTIFIRKECYASSMAAASRPPFTESTLKEPLRAMLGARAPRRLPEGAGKPAAVLIPLFERDGEVHVWLMRRPESMRRHSGQVSFPGGKHDPEDDSMLATALRETHEEIGIAPAEVDVLGQLDDSFTITSFTITPFVGWVSPGAAIVPNPSEVARAFASPLAAFLGAPTGIPPFRGWRTDGEFVWGATAAILKGLVTLLAEMDG